MPSKAWTPDTLLGKGLITEAQYAAAVRYLYDYQQGVAGAGKQIKPTKNSHGAPQNRTPQQAAQSYRDASRAIGDFLKPCVGWCVLSRGTVSGWAKCRGWDTKKAAEFLIAALDRLTEHYGMA